METAFKNIVDGIVKTCNQKIADANNSNIECKNLLNKIVALDAIMLNAETPWDECTEQIKAEFQLERDKAVETLSAVYDNLHNAILDLEKENYRLEAIWETLNDTKFCTEHNIGTNFINNVKLVWAEFADTLDNFGDKRDEFAFSLHQYIAKKSN